MKRQPPPDQPAASSGLFDSALATSVRDQAQQIWLAGMGAFAKAQDEGRQVFESLVTEGASLQKKTHRAAVNTLDEVTGKVAGLADDVGAKAGQQWDRLESIFEDRTARALKKLGVPTSADMRALADRIDALTARLETHRVPSKSASAPKKTAATRAPRKKTTSKTA